MEELRFSIDEEKYDDRHEQVLSLGGWYAGSDRQEMSFCLMGDGNQEIVLADPERYERPDVAQALEADFGEFLPGFTAEDSQGRSACRTVSADWSCFLQTENNGYLCGRKAQTS